MTAPGGLGPAALAEIETAHAFFADWLTGRETRAEALEARLVAFAPDFERVAPDGRIVRGSELARFLSERRAEEGQGLEIAIDEARAVWADARAALVAYVERQRSRGRETRRRSTAFFTASDAAPCGALWRRVHETWLSD